MPIEITSPVGRIVWGHPTKPRKKTRKNDAGVLVDVIKDGKQVYVRSFGVAYPKAEFQASMWPPMAQEAASLYPGGQPPAKFAWKYVDGDGIDPDGKPFNQREGYAGCYILAYSSELENAPPIYKLNGGKYDQLTDDMIKCGDYVVMGTSIKGNIPADRTMTPGLYINPLAIEHIGYGTEIISTGSVDPNAMFGGAARQLPPGASATPMQAPGAPGMPGMGQAPMQQPGMMQPQPMMPQPGQMPGMMAQAPMMAAPAPVMAPPPPPQPVGPQRPTDPTHIQPNPAGGEFWWNGTGWIAAPIMQQPMLPPPATDFVANAGLPMQQPGMMQPQPMMPQPGQMPGMMPLPR